MVRAQALPARPGARWPSGPILAGLAGLAAATAGVALSAQAPPPYPWPIWSVVQAVGLSFVVAGVIAWLRQPENGSGRLMVAVGATWYIGDLQTSTNPGLFAVGFTLFYLSPALLTHLLLALPAGRLAGRAELSVVAGMYAVTLSSQVPRYLVEDPPEPQIWGDLDKVSVWGPIGSIATALLILATFVLVVRRWRRAGRPSRRTLAVLWSTGVVATLIVLGWIVFVLVVVAARDASDKSTVDFQGALLFLYALVLTFVPFAILTGLLRVRLARIGVAALVMRLESSPEPRRLREALADVLGDPTLRLCFRLPGGGYVDVDGHPVEPAASDTQAVTVVSRRGEELATLVHDPALTNQAPLIDAAVAAAGLALENARLYADLRAQLEAVRASRLRIVAAADQERRRIQRDLHDGAQHKLLALSMLVGQIREELPGPRVAALLQLAAAHLHDVIRELRELTEGIDPPALTEQGLAAVVDTKEELLRLVALAPPDVVILDIRLPPGQSDEGLRAASEIRQRHPAIGLLVLSHYAETSYAIRLLENGAHGVGYLVKDRVQDIGRLIDTIRRVAAGEVAIDPEVVHRLLSRRRAVDPIERLTPGEREVLGLIAEGLSNAGIAQRLYCAPKTVEKRITAITQKLVLPHMDNAGRSGVNVRVLAVLTYLRSTDGRALPEQSSAV